MEDIRTYSITPEFYQKVLDLSASRHESISRLDTEAISSLINTAGCLKNGYFGKVFSNAETALSGDVWLGRTIESGEDYLALLAVRGGHKPDKTPTMKMDTFVIPVTELWQAKNPMLACYHLDDRNRYQSPSAYRVFRDAIIPQEWHGMEEMGLSAVVTPMLYGVAQAQKYKNQH